MSPEAIEEALFKEMALEGICNADSDIIHYMDRECDKKSKILPISYNKDGSLSKTSKAVSTEQFEWLENFVKEKCTALGNEIMEGKIPVNPYAAGQKTACDYCVYHGICGFSPKEAAYRKLEKFQWE